VAYWLHMLATVLWIGGLVFQAAVLHPALQPTLPTPEQPRLLEAVRKRFQPLAWLSLGALVVTGLIQMSAHPRYTGLLSVTNAWSASILAKHLVVAAMLAVAAYQTWILQPEIERGALRASTSGSADPAELGALIRRRQRWARLNLALSVAVLGLTALARSS
jgi:uncharacterized membrane protein